MEIRGVWSTLLQLYEQMTQGPGTSQISGGNLAPLEKIEEELQKANPDWDEISHDLDELQSTCNGMIAIAEKNHLHPTSDPNFIQLLQSTSQMIAQLKTEVGTPEFSLKSLLDAFSQIKQDILQG